MAEKKEKTLDEKKSDTEGKTDDKDLSAEELAALAQDGKKSEGKGDIEKLREEFTSKHDELLKNSQRIASKKDEEINELRRQVSDLGKKTEKKSDPPTGSKAEKLQAEINDLEAQQAQALSDVEYDKVARLSTRQHSLQIELSKIREKESEEANVRSESSFKQRSEDENLKKMTQKLIRLNGNKKLTDDQIENLLAYQKEHDLEDPVDAWYGIENDTLRSQRDEYKVDTDRIAKAKESREKLREEGDMYVSEEDDSSSKTGLTFKETIKALRGEGSKKFISQNAGVTIVD